MKKVESYSSNPSIVKYPKTKSPEILYTAIDTNLIYLFDGNIVLGYLID